MEKEQVIEFNENKFKELVLLISERSEDDPWFGATKLNKLLFFSDFLAYGYLGKPITGAVYQALPHGPAPKKLLPIRSQMMREGSLAIKSERVLRFVQKRPTALRQPNVSVFTAEEVEIVEDVLRLLRDRTAGEISEMSHAAAVGWQVAVDQEDAPEIPYNSVFLSARKPTRRHFERVEELAREWAAA